jgi:biotin carboxyl carrier protein
MRDLVPFVALNPSCRIPLSMIATPTPVPSQPKLRAVSAPMAGTAYSVVACTARSGDT